MTDATRTTPDGITNVCRAVLVLCALCVSAAPAASARQQGQSPCADFQKEVRAVYDFKPSRLTDAAREAKSAAMDRFWKSAKARPAATLPCLRAALADPQADPWFRFDGSNLLATLDPSPASKAEQARHYAAVDLADVDLAWFVPKLAQLGLEGFDVSGAGERWLAHADPFYVRPAHGARKVDRFDGALIIFGSMDEAQATPALARVAGQPGHRGRDAALMLLALQATPESYRALRGLASAQFGGPARAALEVALKGVGRVEPRAQPKTTREEFLRAFNALVAGDSGPFSALVSAVPDGEKDVVATLKPEDLPLVRRVRRRFAAAANPHAADYYISFTTILTTLVWRPELVA